MSGLSCPSCNSVKFDPKYEEDGLYICTKCGTIAGYYCRGCRRVYTKNKLGLHGDVYECKICDKIQWGYTEKKRGETY